MTDLTHLDALRQGLAAERGRLAKAVRPAERAARAVWVARLEREVAAEIEFLDMNAGSIVDMSDADLLAELIG